MLDILKSWVDKVLPWHISKTIWIFSISFMWILYYWDIYRKDFQKMDSKIVSQQVDKSQIEVLGIIAP